MCDEQISYYNDMLDCMCVMIDFKVGKSYLMVQPLPK